MKRPSLMVLPAVLVTGCSGVTGSRVPSTPFQCTQVIAYSQVGQDLPDKKGWYVADGAFESAVGTERWQLLWRGGAGVDMWRNADYPGWSAPVLSQCATRSETPDRVLLSVSGPLGEDEPAWAAAIEETVGNIRQKLPSVRQIILQPVVGGPGGQSCLQGAQRVRASWQHAHISRAIERVVAAHASEGGRIVAGIAPQVGHCDDYADALGHLKPAAAAEVGRKIGEYYRGIDAN